MITIYHNPRCRKSREALSILEEHNVELTIIHYLKNPPTEKELQVVLKKLKLAPSDLVRKNEAFWKENYKNEDLSETEVIRILSENPILIERPIVMNKTKAVIGRPPENVLQII